MNKQDLQQLFDKKGIAHKWSEFEPFVRSSVRIELNKAKKEKDIALGQSKMGGLPDLPKSVDWFVWQGSPMSFIAQINFAEAKPYDSENKLPATGIAYFFYDAEQGAWGFDPQDKGSFKVFYFNGDMNELERKPVPEGMDEDTLFSPCKLIFKQEWNLPDWESDLTDDLLDEEDDIDAYIDLLEQLHDEDYSINKLLGHSDNVQGGMELECELVTNGLYCGDSTGYNDPRAKPLRANVKNWQLLLQVDSNDECGMMWGDVGRIYFWIREEDLKNLNFDNAWMCFQCC